MAQKSNLTTLRKRNLSLNLLSVNSTAFLYSITFIEFFNKLLAKKGIFLTQNTLNFNSNKMYLTSHIFFKGNKIQKLKIFSKTNKKENFRNFLLSSKKIQELILEPLKLLKINLLILNVKILNKEINKKLFCFYYKNFKRFLKSFFARQFNFFIDFIKLTTLLTSSKLSAKNYLDILGQIFRKLPKNQHNRFLTFLKIIFKTIVLELPKRFDNNRIKGIKFIVSGRLKGKMRASSQSIKIGKIPTQTLNKTVEFSKIHVYTVYGLFGFKFWLYR